LSIGKLMSSPLHNPLLAQLRALTADLRSSTAEADRLARLPNRVARSLKELGLFRLWIPRRFAGLELSLMQALELYELAGQIDGSIGWATMIGAGGGLFAAFLEPGAASEIFAAPDAVIAGSGAPQGDARRVGGGYRVSGHWRYASGAHYATTFTANCVVTQDGAPVLDASGGPLIRAMAFTPEQVEVLPAWDAVGMRGTGSHDFKVTDAFVPERRTFSVFTDAPRETGPLYRLPFEVLTELPISAVALGVVRHALDEFAQLTRHKRDGSGDGWLADEPGVQIEYAKSHARWYAARAAIHALAEKSWQIAQEGRSLDSRQAAEITAGCVHGVSQLQEAVATLGALAGMTAITKSLALAKAIRDLQTLAAHVAVSPRLWRTSGSMLLSAP
jgi:indole-3-acetate monooxygenase